MFALDFSILNQERVVLLQSIVLTSDEEDSLRRFEGSPTEVGDVDRFYLAIIDVPRSESLLRGLLTCTASHRDGLLSVRWCTGLQLDWHAHGVAFRRLWLIPAAPFSPS